MTFFEYYKEFNRLIDERYKESNKVFWKFQEFDLYYTLTIENGDVICMLDMQEGRLYRVDWGDCRLLDAAKTKEELIAEIERIKAK